MRNRSLLGNPEQYAITGRESSPVDSLHLFLAYGKDLMIIIQMVYLRGYLSNLVR